MAPNGKESITKAIEAFWNDGGRAHYAETWADYDAGNFAPFKDAAALVDSVCRDLRGACVGTSFDVVMPDGTGAEMHVRNDGTVTICEAES